jgi:hypothetical protein
VYYYSAAIAPNISKQSIAVEISDGIKNKLVAPPLTPKTGVTEWFLKNNAS